jgi:uncharacterized membrane protein SpoIIM required for sporulation
VDQRAFVKRRAAAWERLELLLGRIGRHGLRKLDEAEILELGRLYRWLTSDLAYAQGHHFDQQLRSYLNRLTARAHAAVYAGGVESGRTRVARFFAQTFPREVRASWMFVASCIALTIIWACAAYVIVQQHPGDAAALLPAWLVPAHISKSLHDSNFAFTPDQSAMVSSEIITNNIRVAILTFAGGIVTLGAFTVYLITFNALMLGALGALFARAGFGMDYWATIAPHGVIELTAIQIAGGAGLLMGAAVFFPGRLSRHEALRQHARRAGVLIAGVIAMLCVAGVIEGFFSPLRFGPGIRVGVGVITALGLLLYFSSAGRLKEDRVL